jgi:hypothetical protein
MTRGDRRADIFYDAVKRQDFVKPLAAALENTGWQVVIAEMGCLVRVEADVSCRSKHPPGEAGRRRPGETFHVQRREGARPRVDEELRASKPPAKMQMNSNRNEPSYSRTLYMSVAFSCALAGVLALTGCGSNGCVGTVNIPGEECGFVKRDFWHQGTYTPSGQPGDTDFAGLARHVPTNAYERFEWSMNLLDRSVPEGVRFHVLLFDINGTLVNRQALLQAVRDVELRARTARPIRRVVIMSLGWSQDYTTSEEAYRNLLTQFVNHRGGVQTNGQCNLANYGSAIRDLGLDETMFLCVSWDSTYSGVTAITKDLIPGQSLGSALAWPVDKAAFPFTVWSKSALADRIGYGSLKFAVQYLYDHWSGFVATERASAATELAAPPDLYLVGHSFGTRICDALMTGNQRTPLVGVKGRRQEARFAGWTYQKYLRGAVLIEPALAETGLPSDRSAPCPILVAQTRHDHLNSFLYPVANEVLNGETSAFFEANVPPMLDSHERAFSAGSYHWRQFWEAGLDTIRVPETTLFTLEALPFSYFWGLTSEVKNRGWKVFLDTPAQLPLLEIPAQSLTPKRWDIGSRKGLFDMGPLYESSARVSLEPAVRWNQLVKTNAVPEHSATEIAFKTDSIAARGVTFVDAAARLSRGIYTLDYAQPRWDYSVGWLDPVGAHTDGWEHSPTNSEVFDFIYFGVAMAKEIAGKGSGQPR